MAAFDAVVGVASVPHLPSADEEEEVWVKLLTRRRLHETQNIWDKKVGLVGPTFFD